MAYEFHYTPTGTGVISGKEVLEQTEDAINDLGGQISGDVQTAIDTANNALNTANTASADAQNAVNTANTAYTAATNAQNTANTAQNTASNALTAAQNAQNDVNALGNRVTTAENNITQNTSDISGLTTRMGTAEGNIATLQNDVITAQGTATSAQNTATLARGQAYVVRYASVAVSDNSTVPYSNLSNTDNIKANDLLLDINGKIYQISAVDTANETVSVTTPLTQLAVDSGVMHLTGDETAAGEKTFTSPISCLRLRSPDNSNAYVTFRAGSQAEPGSIILSAHDGTNATALHLLNKTFVPYTNNDIELGTSSRKWKRMNGINPGALSLPDFSNAIDISGYITVTGGSSITNNYTPLADGYISVNLGRSSGAIGLIISNGKIEACVRENTFPDNHRECGGFIPVQKNDSVEIISCLADSVIWAYFIPVLGNV